MTRRYQAGWFIDVEADSFHEAAIKAREARDSGFNNEFVVTDDLGNQHDIDLDEDEDTDGE